MKICSLLLSMFVFSSVLFAQVMHSRDSKMSAAEHSVQQMSALESQFSESQAISAVEHNNSTAGTFSGIIREENGRAWVWFDKLTAGTKVFVCNEVLVGKFCTPEYNFTESFDSSSGGGFSGVDIPILPNVPNHIHAYEMVDGQVRHMAMNIDPYNQTSTLIMAAYEGELVFSGDPFGRSKRKLVTIVGTFNPYLPATIFLGYNRINVQVVSTVIPFGTLHSTLVIDNKTWNSLGTIYDLTVCQSEMCKTVKVTHISADGGKG